jgi:hypothetical protein
MFARVPGVVALVLNLATLGIILAWIAFACYAIPYLISH